MCDLCDAIPWEGDSLDDRVQPYLVDRDPGDENDYRARLTTPPRRLRSGERWDGTRILYSSGWLNDIGEVVPFELDDPKHPDHRDLFAASWDMRGGK